MNRGRIEVDSSCWPVVLIRPQGENTEAHYLEMFRQIEEFWTRRERFLTITDTRLAGVGSARDRHLIGSWMKKHEEQTNNYSMGSIIIVSSALIRGAMTAISWIAQPKVPSIYVGTATEAAEQTRKILLENGLQIERAVRLVQGTSRLLAA